MELSVNGARTYCYTGGKAFRPGQPTAVFIHGVLGDHSVWILQTRYLAHHGWNVLAVDLPGHGRSGGEAPASVEDAAAFIAALLDAAGVERAALIGHSWGSLIALEAAAALQARVSHLVLVGTAFPMKVSPALLEASQNEPLKALKMINVFSRATLAAPPSALGPGTWVYGASLALGRRILAGNRTVNVFHRWWRGRGARPRLPGAVRAGQSGPDDAAQGRPGIDGGRARIGPARGRCQRADGASPDDGGARADAGGSQGVSGGALSA
jgi:pimeloyl-ACP methyl ester carboxylesterase